MLSKQIRQVLERQTWRFIDIVMFLNFIMLRSQADFVIDYAGLTALELTPTDDWTLILDEMTIYADCAKFQIGSAASVWCRDFFSSPLYCGVCMIAIVYIYLKLKLR